MAQTSPIHKNIETEASSWSIDQFLQWLTAGLYGGYVAPNVLKWVWWRLNGAGYFAGMIAGIIFAMASLSVDRCMLWLGEQLPGLQPLLTEWLPYLTPLNLFPLILLLSGMAAVFASHLTPPDDDAVLEDFCRRVRPWGFWKPVEDSLRAADPEYRSNDCLGRDALNCAIGIVWQIGLSALPVFVVLRHWDRALTMLVVVLVTSVVLKFSWYDRLPFASDDEDATAFDE